MCIVCITLISRTVLLSVHNYGRTLLVSNVTKCTTLSMDKKCHHKCGRETGHVDFHTHTSISDQTIAWWHCMVGKHYWDKNRTPREGDRPAKFNALQAYARLKIKGKAGRRSFTDAPEFRFWLTRTELWKGGVRAKTDVHHNYKTRDHKWLLVTVLHYLW